MSNYGQEEIMRKKFLLFMLILLLVLSGCGQTDAPAVQPETVTEDVENIKEEKAHREYSLRISELMSKNRATLRDADGDFSDWIEIENYGNEAVSLKGLYLDDKAGGKGWEFPDRVLDAGGHLLVYASGKDRQSDELHTDFSLSEGETAVLKDEYGDKISSLDCIDAHADISVVYDEAEGAKLSLYPSPGADNDTAGYIKRQKSIETPKGLIINEVCVSNLNLVAPPGDVYPDWIELGNTSDEAFELSDYYLTDNADELRLMKLPAGPIYPGNYTVVFCDETLFKLASDYDQLYLTDGEKIIDYLPLHNTTYGGSFGRQVGENGFFYYEITTPGAANVDGCRYIAETPKALTKDGVFEGVDSVMVELSAPGKIYYTLDGNYPTVYAENCFEYKGPFTVSETCAVRAISIENGALTSRPLALNYIINEHHELPVVCLDMNSYVEFYNSYMSGWKETDNVGNISFYEPGGSFSIDGTVKLNGETSLVLDKKNLSVRFRGSLGQSELNYDLYGGGVTEFRDFVLRAGQDYYSTVIKNELSQELCLEFTDNVISQRSRFCALYINGTYYGLYTIKEKCNEALYANIRGVDANDVTVEEANVYSGEVYDKILDFAATNDMSLPENYETICEYLDIDSLIDWLIAQGYCANNDLSSGNLRYCKLNAPGEKWKLMHYDLDATFVIPEFIFINVIGQERIGQQITTLARALMKNAEFKDRFLTRAGEAMSTVFTNEHVIELTDSMCAEIENELIRDNVRYLRDINEWRGSVDNFRKFIVDADWTNQAKDNLISIFNLTPEEAEHYFG